MKKLSFLTLALFAVFNLGAQTISMDMPQYIDMLRRAQLNGKLDQGISFASQPINISKNVKGDSSLYKLTYGSGLFKNVYERKKVIISVLPFSSVQQYVTRHPFKQNDGPMIPASGYQSMFSGGIFVEAGPISLQFKPQFVFAQNKNFQGFPEDYDNIIWAKSMWDQIDVPEKFGNKSYHRSFLGNSSIRLNLGSFSAGIGTENIWWGPAMNNPLLFSSHATGFLHASINTRKPLKTFIGNFEAQMIMGKLKASGFDLPAKKNGTAFFGPKDNDFRYINAVMLSFSPRFLNGLSLGITRSIQMYEHTRKETGKWLIALNNVARKNDPNEIAENNRDQIASLFMRYFSIQHKYELYTEWGRADAFFNLRDLMQAADHTQGYTVGFRKLYGPEKKQVQFLFEATHLQKNSGYFNRLTPSWYVHATVRHGFTNQGEVLGAYIGPGSNIQTMRISQIRGMKQFGIQLERTVQNVDFYEEAFNANEADLHKWVDFGVSLIGDYDYKKFLFSCKLTKLKSFNYQWHESTSIQGVKNDWDVNDFLLQFGIGYRL